MIENSTLKLIKSFDRKKINDFQNYCECHLFNSSKALVKLVSIIGKNNTKLNSAVFERENLYKLIFSNDVYNEQVLKNLFVKLHNAVEDFLALKEIRSNSALKNILIANQYSKIKDSKLAEKLLRQLDKNNNQLNKDISQESYLYNYWFEYSKNSFYRDFGMSSAIFEDEYKESNSLLFFFLSAYFSNLNETFINKDRYQFDNKENLAIAFAGAVNWNEFFNHPSFKKNNAYPYLQAYYYMYLIHKEGIKEEYYRKLKYLTYLNIHSFSAQEKFNFFMMLENSCIFFINSGEDSYQRELSKIYQDIFKLNLVKSSEGAYLQDVRFRNIIRNMILLNKINWTEDFIIKNFEDLHPDMKSDNFNFGMGLVYFSRKDFKGALRALNKVNFQSDILKINVRNLQIAIFYELNDDEAFESSVQSLKKLLKSNKSIPKVLFELSNSFLKVSMLLYKKKNGIGNPKDIDKNEVAKYNSFFKKWLIEKWDELYTK